MAYNKIWRVCNVCGGTGKVMAGEPIAEVECDTCHGDLVVMTGFIAKDLLDAQEALTEQ